MMSVETELSWCMLEVEPLGSACGILERVDGITQNNTQAFVEQLDVWCCVHSNGDPLCKQSFLLVYLLWDTASSLPFWSVFFFFFRHTTGHK